MLTLATSVHLVVYPRRRGLIFLSYIASLKPELHDNVNRPTVFFRSGCSRSIFFPQKAYWFSYSSRKRNCFLWIRWWCDLGFFPLLHIVWRHLYILCVCVCVGSCQQIRRTCLFFCMRPWAWVFIVILVISILTVPCDMIFIKVPPTKCHDHIKNIFEIGLSFFFQLIFRTGMSIMYKIYQVS